MNTQARAAIAILRWEMPTRIQYIIDRTQLLVLMAVLAILVGPFGIACAKGAPPNQQSIIHVAPDFSGSRVWLTGALIVLMGALFFVLFWWQRRIEV